LNDSLRYKPAIKNQIDIFDSPWYAVAHMKNQSSAFVLFLSLALGFIATACGTTGSHTPYTGSIVIIRYGVYGYYNTSGSFCSYLNNYCETGEAFGITNDGCSYLGGNACPGAGGGDPSNPTVHAPIVIQPISPPILPNPNLNISVGNGGTSIAATTKDVDLQRAQLAQQDLQARAQHFATRFQMNFESAFELTQLADTMQTLSAQNKFTGEDQLAISQTALTVAGISQTDFQAAMGNYLNNHDSHAFDALIDQGANHLGMPSSAALRDQILPSLGLSVNHL
jgi:hypothetical protein